MSILDHLSALALQGAGFLTGDGLGLAAGGVQTLAGLLRQRFTDHSERLTRALKRSHDRAWRAVELALAGSSWWGRCQGLLSSGDERAFRDQVQAFLNAHPLDGIDGHGPDFRAQCLVQMREARKKGLLDGGTPDANAVAQDLGDLSRFGDPSAVVEAQWRSVAAVSQSLRGVGYDALATYLTLRPASGPPLLASALRFFFQREVESDRELFQGLAYARLEALSEGQQTGFAGLAESLDRHGDRLEELLGDVRAVVVQTQRDVLDIKDELGRQGQQMQELGQAVLKALAQHHLERRELAGADSLSVRGDEERRLVKQLVAQYRSLPADKRQQMPALLNAVGKLEVMAGDFESAQRDFEQLATLVSDPHAQAEAAHNRYCAALERRSWDEALLAINEAGRLNPARFAPFPLEKYEAERILGAGGFGVAFLCKNRHSSARVVIKTLRRDGLDRDLNEVFREAQALEEIEHPAIIRVRDCDYADTARTRPFIVMDYFPGVSLTEWVEQHGPLPLDDFYPLARMISLGMQKAHDKGILHRDIKPANVLVRRNQGKWEVKLIDFGLAMRTQAGASTTRSQADRTLLGASIAGTLEYAAPEQMGKLRGVTVAPYSDVYGFGKMCCFALFSTPQPTFQHWQKLPPQLAEALGKCLTEAPRERPADFYAVLGSLSRAQNAAAVPVPPPVPPRSARPLMDAQPVRALPIEEAIPVEPARPIRRRRTPDEREPEERPRVASTWPYLVFPALGIAVFMGLMLWLLPWMPWNRTVTNPNPGLQLNASNTPTFPAVNQPGNNQIPGTPVKPKPAPAAAKPISQGEFPKVLAELKSATLDRQAELAARLAVTNPRPSQKTAHAKALKTKLKTDQDRDQIAQVSLALEPLGKDKNDARNKAYAEACIKWGTKDNVATLIEVVEGANRWGYTSVLPAVEALGVIKDARAARSVADRLNFHKASHELQAAAKKTLIAIGAPAEDEVLRLVTSGDSVPAKRNAIEVLGKIGTRKSEKKLEAASKETFIDRDATKALAEIRKRELDKK